MVPVNPLSNLSSRLLATGHSSLGELLPLIDRADPKGLVSPRSRLLCAALSQLALECYKALGGQRWEPEVKRAAAMLALLTKIDDQIIDGPGFHGGAVADRDDLRVRTRAYLRPTLDSLVSAAPADGSPRCELAAGLGRILGEIGEGPRLAHLHQVIASGWSVQEDAVVHFTSRPGEVDAATLEDTTARISGDWLLMITLIGTLPPDAGPLTADEEHAFGDWGWHIQRADALSDLDRDIRDGLICTAPGWLLWERLPMDYLRACKTLQTGWIYRELVVHDLDLACLPHPSECLSLDERLGRLGDLGPLLRWIHGFLCWRYLVHPLCRRAADDERFRAFVGHGDSWSRYLAEVMAHTGDVYPHREESRGAKGARCSAR